MTRTYTSIIFLLCVIIGAVAQPAESSTILSTSKAKSISIISSPDRTNITVKGIENGRDNFYYKSATGTESTDLEQTSIYAENVKSVSICEAFDFVKVDFSAGGKDYSYTLKLADPGNRHTTSYTSGYESDFSFTLSRSKKVRWSAVSDGLGIGWMSPVKDRPDMDVSMSKSNELSWLMILGVKVARGSNSFAFGLGIDWQNYVTKGSRYFQKNADGRITLEPYDAAASKTRSRIKIFSLQVPMLYGLDFGHNSSLHFKIGPIVNFNTGGSIKTQYTLGGRRYSVKTTGIGQRPVTVDGYASMSFGVLGVYCRYSPMKKLRHRAGLDFGSISTGLVLTF